MTLIDLLRKLGVVRYGATAATYTSAKDAPAELLMDGVLDAEKDLVGGSARGSAPAPVPQDPGSPPPRRGRGPLFWVASGCSGCLVITVGFAAILVGGLLRFESGAAPGQGTGHNEASSRGGGMKTDTVELRKEPAGAGTQVIIRTRTRGFGLRREGDGYRVHLVGDLETLDPRGKPIVGLSKAGFYSLVETLESAEGAHADFKTDLTFRDARPGRYSVRITIRDRVGGGRDLHRVSFDLP